MRARSGDFSVRLEDNEERGGGGRRAVSEGVGGRGRDGDSLLRNTPSLQQGGGVGVQARDSNTASGSETS